MSRADPVSNTLQPALGMARYLWFGSVAILLLIGTLGGWGAWAPIHGAVIAPATVVVETNAKKVQHAEGGIVAELLVRDGEQVTAGQILVRFDETENRANLAIIDARLNELLALQARLEAERDNATEITFPDELTAQAEDRKIGKILQGQRRLFEARRKAAAGEKAQLKQRILQLEDEIEGLDAQQASKQEQIELIRREHQTLKELKAQGLVQMNRVLALEREAARLKGEKGQLIAEIARARGRISETELRITQTDQNAIKTVLTELRDAQARIAEFLERRVAVKAKLLRITVPSPRDGFVHQLSVHAVGAVVKAGEPIMVIVPERDALVVEAAVRPQDVDQIRVGQQTMIRFSAFDQRSTPELEGEVDRISADLMPDAATGQSHYLARIRLVPGQIEKLDGKPLKAGMPAEVFVQTSARTAISYLLKPLSDQITRAFREE